MVPERSMSNARIAGRGAIEGKQGVRDRDKIAWRQWCLNGDVGQRWARKRQWADSLRVVRNLRHIMGETLYGIRVTVVNDRNDHIPPVHPVASQPRVFCPLVTHVGYPPLVYASPNIKRHLIENPEQPYHTLFSVTSFPQIIADTTRRVKHDENPSHRVAAGIPNGHCFATGLFHGGGFLVEMALNPHRVPQFKENVGS